MQVCSLIAVIPQIIEYYKDLKVWFWKYYSCSDLAYKALLRQLGKVFAPVLVSMTHRVVYKKSQCLRLCYLGPKATLWNWNAATETLFCAQITSFSCWSQSNALDRPFLRHRRCHRITWLIAALTSVDTGIPYVLHHVCQ